MPIVLYNETVRIVDESGNIISGTASAVTALYNKTIRVVDSSGNVIDSFGGGSATPVMETPSGSIPGTAYTLSSAPIANTLILLRNGIVQNPGAGNDYTISGTTVTFAATTVAGDTLLAYYWK